MMNKLNPEDVLDIDSFKEICLRYFPSCRFETDQEGSDPYTWMTDKDGSLLASFVEPEGADVHDANGWKGNTPSKETFSLRLYKFLNDCILPKIVNDLENEVKSLKNENNRLRTELDSMNRKHPVFSNQKELKKIMDKTRGEL